METSKATIRRDGESAYLVLNLNGHSLEIVLTDDNPNNIKSVFNALLRELKNGIICFELDDKTEDLYYHICTEYVLQLNSELKSVFEDFEEFDLLPQD